MTIGVTGGIGSGKTTVCRLFEMLDIPVYYADKEAKRLMSYDKALKKQIKTLLGPECYHRNGRLNRAVVASIIFTNQEKREALNQLVHPAVRKDAHRWAERQDAPYTLQEAALLVENGSYKDLDKLIVVTAPESVRVDRVMKRDGASKAQVQRRIDSQLPETAKVKVADYVIDNGGKKSLVRQIWKIHNELIAGK